LYKIYLEYNVKNKVLTMKNLLKLIFMYFPFIQ